MASMKELGASHVWRIAAVGDPGSAKTGAIASVVNGGGYNLRIIDLDGNTEPLFQFIDREHWGKVDIQRVEEDLYLKGAAERYTEADGKPELVGQFKPLTSDVKTKNPIAFRTIWALLEDWPQFGPVEKWGPKDILMIDSASPIIFAAERKVMKITGHDSQTRTFDDQRQTNSEFLGLLERLKSRRRTPCNLYVTFHRKLQAPEMIQESRTQKMPELNKEVLEKKAAVLPTKFYPNAPGRACGPLVGSYFSTVLLFETIFEGEKPVRVIRTVPKPEMDVKVPVKGLKTNLPVETGLWTIVQALETAEGQEATRKAEAGEVEGQSQGQG